MPSHFKYPGAPARCGLWLLLFAAISCDYFRHSPCVDEPMQTGCHVTMSVSPSHIKRNEAATLALSFKESGISQLVAGLQDPPRVMLEQGERAIQLSSPKFGPEGSIEVSISDAQTQKLSIGEAQLRLATDGGSVTARVRVYVEPKLIPIYVDTSASIRKWAGRVWFSSCIVECGMKNRPADGAHGRARLRRPYLLSWVAVEAKCPRVRDAQHDPPQRASSPIAESDKIRPRHKVAMG